MNRKNLICLLILFLPTAILFGPALIQGETLAYRDSGRFYYRQFEWNKTQWLKGEIPLWNSQENLGAPVVAEASSSVFYPGQAIFLIPLLKFSAAFVIYAAIHVYLASIGTFFVARELGCRRPASLFAAISYSISGSLIFQSCNIVFLVGGCWLPFCLWMSYRLMRAEGFSQGITQALWMAFFLAMAVLGGDPQTGFHVGLLSLLLITWKFFRSNPIDRKRLPKVVGWHLVAAVLAFGLAAIQILPSWQATQKSTRSYSKDARSIWELMETEHTNSAQGIFGHPEPMTHHDHLYQFSQRPWSLMELLWPNIGGSIVGTNGRWTDAAPSGGRSWSPSIYCGLLTFAFFLSGLFRRSKHFCDGWLKTGFLFFAIGSLGWYGLGWVLHEIQFGLQGTNPAESKIGSPVGGVYWFLVVVLPGYVNFRYPAKLFLVASLFLCLLAAREFNTLIAKKDLARLRQVLLILFCLSTLACIATWLTSISINRHFERIALSSTSEFGPFDPSAAWKSILWALIHSAIVCLVTSMVLNQKLPLRWTIICVLGISLVDLWVANRQLVITARSSLWDRTPVINEFLEERVPEGIRIYRTNPMTWSTKNEWLQGLSPNRLEQIVDYENQTLMSRHHLANQLDGTKIGLVESFRSIEDVRFATVISWIESLPGIKTNDSYDVPLAPNPIALGVLSCRYLLIPQWGRPQLPGQGRVKEIKNSESWLVQNPYFVPRFRVVTDFNVIKPVKRTTSWLQDPSNRKILNESSRFVDPKNLDFVESDRPLDDLRRQLGAPSASDQANGDSTTIEIIRNSNTEIELDVSGGPGLLIVADQFDEDWQAYVELPNQKPRRVSILKTNLITSGIPLFDESAESESSQSKFGKTRVRLVYRPQLLIRGSWISAATIVLYFVMFCVGWSKSRRTHSNQNAV